MVIEMWENEDQDPPFPEGMSELAYKIRQREEMKLWKL